MKCERYQPLHPDSIKYMKMLDDQPKVQCMEPDEGKNIKQEDVETKKESPLPDVKMADKPKQNMDSESLHPENQLTANVGSKKGHCRCYFKGKRLK